MSGDAAARLDCGAGGAVTGAGGELAEARAALRLRQGAGLREDAAAAPHTELALARLGTAFFARQLTRLDDAELAGPSLLPGWSRAALVAHVGYNARALTRLVAWAETGVETPMYASPEQRAREIERGASLPPRALRALFAHSEVHLNVAWRDLPSAAWSAEVVTAQGRTVPVSETAWMRTREVWVHAVDLANGVGFGELPPELLDRLAADVLAGWQRRGERVAVTLVPTDRDEPLVLGDGSGPEVVGAQADLVRWLTGRGARRLTHPGETPPALPRWL
ncbi:maleylpyruvate isomerase family mycothiol-dependent enzyme [Streptomyces sp. 3MP-14]|uniref:Maleylpyruvate isomerase family mycothiol-dependent enzyme n=1 Tax=Streptomyces mimosae TaxID=2586635 RepID=A0A5N5ZYF5_9ACTN|nr:MULTISPECIES: maleylpyruvate isomerase family mycothiol-dependent enzyme [Streptomyces]KAB8161305.1 maleylpyruvate isomerase family mycothiol-dependent enzyme [Streptomyces mimosae]KAB8173107.1 maleylpyruvate isomerase family mycothiol-dependent enzyme [Streptomyces sp. 3MP-14]